MNLTATKSKARRLYKQGARLDNKGKRPRRVERVFLRAIALDPFNLAYHRRYVARLIRSRKLEEAREAWDRALDLLRNPEGPNKASFYRLLHKEVAKVAFECGENEFFKDILLKIPSEVLTKDKELVVLCNQLYEEQDTPENAAKRSTMLRRKSDEALLS